MIEPRTHSRSKALKNACIVRRDLQLIIDCTLRNHSEEGALIDLESGIVIPHEFELLVKANKLIAPCQLVWRKHNKIGVRLKSEWREASAFV